MRKQEYQTRTSLHSRGEDRKTRLSIWNDQKNEDKISSEKAIEIAAEVYGEIKGWGSSAADIVAIFSPYKNNAEAMSMIRSAYKKSYGYSMDAHIRSDFEGEELKSIETVIKVENKSAYTKVPVGTDNAFAVVTSGGYSKANSFLELVRLVRIAEDKLIDAGYVNIEDRIRILRGIYYGTEWSMDYGKEKSDMRNHAFRAYTASTDNPANPLSILGESLFKALKDTPELKDGNRSVDFGHLIIGLEARSSYSSREVNLPTILGGVTGLEASTWIGDLGGGAGMVAMRRIKEPGVHAKEIVFNGSGHDYGAIVNLEGDIAAYVLNRDKTEKDGPSYPELKKFGYISDSLADYLLKKDNKTTSTDWNERVRIFAQMIGAKIENNAIINKGDLIAAITTKLADFGGLYAVIRMYSSNMVSEENYKEASKHILGASKEVAETFVDMLDKCVKNPSQPLLATLDPAPSAKGQPYGSLSHVSSASNIEKSFYKKSEQIQKQIKKWMK
ncbi:MAG TPA: hypothetical protein VNB90_00085 [Cytophagaceae bacterium]|nr:hypothetical protein [Cytophagaceae bacterium]